MHQRRRVSILLEEDALIEHAEYAGGSYGSRRSALSALGNHQSVIFEVDVQGKNQIVREIPQSVFIFILPPSFEGLERRLKSRGTESLGKVAIRLEQAKQEIAENNSYQYQQLKNIYIAKTSGQ